MKTYEHWFTCGGDAGGHGADDTELGILRAYLGPGSYFEERADDGRSWKDGDSGGGSAESSRWGRPLRPVAGRSPEWKWPAKDKRVGFIVLLIGVSKF